jgi:hypothetical protein
LFKVATDAEARPMPVVALADVEGIRFDGFSRIIDARNVGVAIRLTLRELGDKTLKERLQGALLKMVALPSQCILLLDLSGADLSSADPVGEYIVAAFQRVYEIGNWRRVVVEATSYPESNPAQEDGEILLPRNEWKAWKLAVAHDATIRQQLTFGDFGADSSKFVFSSGAIAQIRHYRYSTEDHWLVVRGNKAADALTAMRGVASRIVGSKHFAGRVFSQADEYIFETAAGRQKNPGSAMTWRKVNTVHHLTRVANDLGSMYGYAVVRRSEHSPQRQIDMFPQTN